jgi:hypothetical protein
MLLVLALLLTRARSFGGREPGSVRSRALRPRRVR